MRTIISILLLFFCCVAFCNTTPKSDVDSLRTLIEKLPKNDTTRLVHLLRIAQIKQSTRPGLEAAKELYTESERLNMEKYKGYAALFAALFYTNNGISDSISVYAKEASEIAEKEQLWSSYFDASKLNINRLIMDSEYEYAIEEALKMYDRANTLNYLDGKITASLSLATAYIGSHRIDESINVLKEVYKDAPKISNPSYLIEMQSLLSSTAHQAGNYDDLYMYLKDLEKTLSDLLKQYPFSEHYYSIYMFIDIHYAYYYVAQKQPQEALKHLKKVEELKKYPIFTVYQNAYYDAYAEYYTYMKEYNHAIAAIDSSIVELKTFMPKDYYLQLVKKADILNTVGRSEEALDLYKKSLHGKDSIDHILSSKQMDQIQSIYNANKSLLENERIRTNQQIILLVVITMFTFLFAAFIIRARFVRKKLKESEEEMRKASHTAEEANEVKNLFLSNMSYNIRTPLNSVVGFSQLMALEPDMDETQRKEYSSIIKTNSEKLLNLVNDVLDLSRLESGMMKFNIQEYDIITLCKEVIYTVKAKEKPIHITFQPEFNEQLIRVDIVRFSQLLMSVLTSPVDSNDEISITFIITLDKDNHYIRFKTVGSPIANPELTSQEITIRNEINALFLKRFGGGYTIDTHSSEYPVIVFTYPLSISE